MNHLRCQLLEFYGPIIGLSAEDYCKELKEQGPDGPREGYRPTDKYFRMMYVRLFLFDAGTARGENMSRFRLVFESAPSGLRDEKALKTAVKVFEFVQGARIRGVGVPDAVVVAGTPITTNQGREFRFLQRTRSDHTGRFEFVVPYATTGTPYNTKPHGQYSIYDGKRLWTVDVSERDIQEGRTIAVPGS